MSAEIRAIARYFPSGRLSNHQLSEAFPEWSVDKIADKTGIHNRYVSGENEFSSDLGLGAAKRLLEEQGIDVEQLDYLIFVTQSPDFALPTTACLVHEGLGMKRSAGAIDLNMGCSGYIYGLGMAQALVSSGQANNVLLVTSDTYTKYLNVTDKSVRTIFGDGATATWVARSDEIGSIGQFTYGTEGGGARHLIVPHGGLRDAAELAPRASTIARELVPSNYNLFMDGAEIFNFTLRVAGPSLSQILKSNSLEMEDIDYFVFHQANAFMLEHLRKKLDIPAEKFPVMMANWGNTVSSTIPMAIVEMRQAMKLSGKKRLLLMGFGVGLSWGGTVVNFDFD
jgi:3-oxoacyl-[acyl-carrier-protein] synthase-3